MSIRVDHTGYDNGQFIVTGHSHSDGVYSYWGIHCACGVKKIIRSDHVKRLKSCGCKTSGLISDKKKTHGGSKSALYKVWRGMLERCSNPKKSNYHRYGGRGIRVCKRWLNFAAFIEDMGERPAGMSVERIDNNGWYSPENCKWATSTEQANNTRSTVFLDIDGETKSVSQWSVISGISSKTIASRLRRNWPAKYAVWCEIVETGKKVNRIPWEVES